MNTKKVCFISDAHFGIELPGQEDREERFFSFLKRETSDLSDLYIVGDLFDFWIEYQHAIRPDYFLTLHHLKTVIDAGVAVHYLAGNHDFALGVFLEKTIGLTIHAGAITREIQGKKVYLFHGDGLIKRDIGYRVLKKILRNPTNQRLYRLLHPAIGVRLGSFVSGSSRKFLNRSKLPQAIINEYRTSARKKLRAGSDIVIYGHIHHPEVITYPEGIYCNTGAWLRHYSYAIMQNGSVSVYKYNNNGTDELYPPAHLK